MNAHVKDGIITFADGYHEHIDALDKAAEQDVRCSIRPEEFIICKDGTDGIHGTVQECTTSVSTPTTPLTPIRATRWRS